MMIETSNVPFETTLCHESATRPAQTVVTLTTSTTQNPNNPHCFPQSDRAVVGIFGKSTTFVANGKTVTVGGVAKSLPVEEVGQVIKKSFRANGGRRPKVGCEIQ